MKKVVVVLFTYNERDTLEKTVKEILNIEKDLRGHKLDIVISDSKSPDGTGELAQKLTRQYKNIHYISVERGIGIGIIEGHKFALKNLKPDIMAQIDADGQVEVDVLPKLVEAIDEGYDLALGSRFVQGGQNKLNLSRRIFTWGSSMIFRLLIGPFDIHEVTNSARAFTPELFNKINLDRLPWKEQSFIVQPAFLHEAVLAGAKYKEVPLVFKDRAEGYSKNKVFNYIYDMVSYSLEAFFQRFGLQIPIFSWSHKSKTVIKFSVVGLSGTLVDFFFYNLFIKLLLIPPASSKGLSAEVAIFNNFILNNIWTFKHRKTGKSKWQKFLLFNLFSLGGLLISVLIVKGLHILYGDGYIHLGPVRLAYYNLYFFATIPPVMVWNFTINHLVTWKQSED